MFSQANILPSREDLPVTQPNFQRPAPEASSEAEWFASFELKVDGRTRYFTFGDRALASTGVECLLKALPPEFRDLLQKDCASGVKISVTLMNGVSLHAGADPHADSAS